MTQPVFLYGTLCDPELFEIVSGTPLSPKPAKLEDTRIHLVAGESFPVPRSTHGEVADGIVVTPDPTARRRLDFYELGFGYDVETRVVQTNDGILSATMYVPHTEWDVGAPWNLEEWQVRFGALSRLAAIEYMRLFETHSPEDAARAFPQIRMRAASRLRARKEPSPAPFEPSMTKAPIQPQKTAQPYTDYFAVREDWLSFPKFDREPGPAVKRASFLGGDAVTVLPYDPKLDAVLLVRQFRHGAFARGDLNPWTLEPAAGRIDPGETPEEAAARELLEETGVAVRDLHPVGRYYPSPGAYSEYLYSYIAIAELDGQDRGVSGLEEEGEDIMRHVVPLQNALALIGTGAANTAPLILSLTWLALNKTRIL